MKRHSLRVYKRVLQYPLPIVIPYTSIFIHMEVLFLCPDMNVSEKIIQKAIDDHMVNALAFHFLIKQRYENSVVYNYTPKKLSSVTGISVNSIKRYIGWLKNQEAGLWKGSKYEHRPLVFFVGKNLHFSRVQPRKHIARIKLNNCTLKEIKYLLYGTMIRANISHQKHSIKAKSQIKRVIQDPKRGEKRLYGRYQREYNGVIDVCPKTSVSVRRMCSDLNIGITTLCLAINHLEEKKIVKRIKGRKYLLRQNGRIVTIRGGIANCIVDCFKADNPYSYVTPYKGCVLVCETTQFKFR